MFNSIDIILYFRVIGLLGLIPGRSESFFSSQNIRVFSEACSASCSVGPRGHLHWVKAAGVVGLTTDLRKLPRLTRGGLHHPSPMSLHGMDQDNCVFTVVGFFEIL